jgi:2OG-Fe(II) oxygenase superfamily
MPRRFHWIAFDVAGSLPPGWEHEIRAVAEAADFRKFPRTPVLSREAPDVRSIPRGRVHADQVGLRLPWLQQSYRGAFLALARQVCAEPVMAARDNRYGIVLNVQRGTTMRFECHIDSNPLTGLLFCTDHRAGGELVIANDTTAADVAGVERDCSVIRPQAGHLIFFDARRHPHYARPLTVPSDMRVTAVMNFYTESCPESTRPRELNKHLYGDGFGRPGRDCRDARPAAGRESG